MLENIVDNAANGPDDAEPAADSSGQTATTEPPLLNLATIFQDEDNNSAADSSNHEQLINFDELDAARLKDERPIPNFSLGREEAPATPNRPPD